MNDAALKKLLEEQGPPDPASGRKRPGEIEPCVQCRLHAGKIGPEKAANYYPPLGLTIAVPTESGGVVYLCPRCSTFESAGETTTLLQLGLVSRRAIRRSKFKVKV